VSESVIAVLQQDAKNEAEDLRVANTSLQAVRYVCSSHQTLRHAPPRMLRGWC
jgi:hypothetical protein